MEKLLLFVPATLFFTFMGILYLKRKRFESKWDSPFRDDQERPPGESLRIKIDELYDEFSINIFTMLIGAVMPITLISHSLPKYLAVGVVLGFVLWMWLSARILLKLIPRIWNYRIGFQGERLTGHYLQDLVREGYFVFHDIPMGEYNVDHVVVGPNGMYAIETKTRRKKKNIKGENYKVVYDGNSLHYPDCKPERFGLEAAVSRAKGLQEWISSAVGQPIMVKPILALPGWFVEWKNPGNPPVMSPTSLKNFVIKNPCGTLDEPKIKMITHQLRQLCSLKREEK